MLLLLPFVREIVYTGLLQHPSCRISPGCLEGNEIVNSCITSRAVGLSADRGAKMRAEKQFDRHDIAD